jgi:hypothetical protein
MIVALLAVRPSTPAVEHAVRLAAEGQVGNEWRGDRQGAQHDEDREDTCLLAAGQAGLSDRHRRGGGQNEVLGIHPRQCRTEAERLARRDVVQGRHPLRRRGLLAGPGTAPPLPDRQEQEQYPKRQLDGQC